MKQALLTIFFFFQAILLVWSQVVVKNDEQVEGFLTLPQETVFLHYNASFLLSGEYLYYKIYCLNAETSVLSDLSKVAYVELVGKTGEPVFKHKVLLKNGQGNGDFFIPTTVPTGSYKILGYTHWMLNEGISTFFQGDITIVNPYQESRMALQSGFHAETDSLQKPSGLSGNSTSKRSTTTNIESRPLRLSLDRERYGKREKVSFSLTADEASLLNGSYSISVRKKDGVATPEQSGMLDVIGDEARQRKTLNVGDKIHLPELRGELFAGTVETLNTGLPAKNAKVGVSVPGDDYYLNVAATDANGYFYFTIDAPYSRENLVLQILGKNQKDYKIGLYKTPPLDYSQLDFNPIRLRYSMKNEILQRSVHNQIENSYFRFRPDSLSASSTPQIFDNKEKEVFILDDYTRFKSIRETILEIVKDVSSERIDGNNHVIKVKGFDYASPSSLLPIVLLDGGLVQDHNALLDFDARLIEEITVLRHTFIIGPEMYRGAFLLKSKEGTGYQNFLANSTTAIVDIFKPEPDKRYFIQRYSEGETNSRLPDDRLQLLWMPSLKIARNKFQIDLYTSDVSGEFEICLEGITNDNRPVSVRKYFRVE